MTGQSFSASSAAENANAPEQVLPLVSIITPSYNQAAYLEQTIQSVLTQDYPFLEYLVIDGGSTDGSQEIIERYADRNVSDHRLAWWVSEPDLGQADAINKGFRHARGEIVAWLNSDDLYLPHTIRQAVGFLEGRSELGMVYGDAITIDAQGALLNRLEFGDWGLPDLMSFRIICQPAVFMRRRVVDLAAQANQSKQLDTSYHFMLDTHLWIRMARLAPIQHVPQVWAAARHHPTAKNVARSEAFGQETMRILQWMQEQPDLAPLVANHRKRILAGAHRLSARYLLDGGQPKAALSDYRRALRYDPRYTLRHWQRMLYALACLVGAQKLADRLAHWNANRKQRPLSQSFQTDYTQTTKNKKRATDDE